MAIANVACPKCAQTFRSSDDVKGTRISCPLCGFGFVVKGFVAGAEGPRLAKPKAKPAEDDDDNPDPYGVTTVTISARCPNCANQMDSETAIICLYCGYNTQTRSLGQTKRVVEQTKIDNTKWLMPGVLCAIGILVLIFLQHYYVVGLGAGMRGVDSMVLGVVFSEPIYLWITLIIAGVVWKLGQFVFKRLILEPVPPEEAKE